MRHTYQEAEFVFPSGTSGSVEKQTILEQGHNCTGVAIFENAVAENINYKVGMRDSAGVYHSTSHKRNLVPGQEASLNDLYKNISIPCKGATLKVPFFFPQPTEGETIVTVVFRLERDED